MSNVNKPLTVAINPLSKIYFRIVSRLHKYMDQRFDRQRNIETSKIVCISDLQDNIDFSAYNIDELYAGTPTHLFKGLHAPAKQEKLQEATYIDIGSGKGRMLIQAAEAGFTNICGIEISPTLANEGRENCEKAITTQNVKWDISTKDATKITYPDGNLVIFMYNPFDQIVFDKFLDNLVANIKNSPRSVIIIYNHAHYAYLLDEHIHLKRIKYPSLTHLKLKLLNPHPFGAWKYSPTA